MTKFDFYNKYFKLPDDCNLQQAEKSTIKRTVKWLDYHMIYGKEFVIVTDSRSAIMSIIDVFTTSNLAHEYWISLKEMKQYSNIHWAWGHDLVME